jgi:vacuolar-type H+-ATPase subunit H
VSRKDRFRQSRTPAREAADRIEAVVEAAERAAESVIDDAEKQARSYLSEAQAEADRAVAERLASLSALTDMLLTQAEAIGRQAEGLLASLEAAKAEIEADSGERPDVPDDPGDRRRPGRGAHLSAVEGLGSGVPSEAEPEQDSILAPEPREDRRGTPAGARLLATQMAVSGNSREEIELRLRNGFDIDDTTSILDAILGPEE